MDGMRCIQAVAIKAAVIKAHRAVSASLARTHTPASRVASSSPMIDVSCPLFFCLCLL